MAELCQQYNITVNALQKVGHSSAEAIYRWFGIKLNAWQHEVLEYLDSSQPVLQARAPRRAGKSMLIACYASYKALSTPDRFVLVVTKTAACKEILTTHVSRFMELSGDAVERSIIPTEFRLPNGSLIHIGSLTAVHRQMFADILCVYECSVPTLLNTPAQILQLTTSEAAII